MHPPLLYPITLQSVPPLTRRKPPPKISANPTTNQQANIFILQALYLPLYLLPNFHSYSSIFLNTWKQH